MGVQRWGASQTTVANRSLARVLRNLTEHSPIQTEDLHSTASSASSYPYRYSKSFSKGGRGTGVRESSKMFDIALIICNLCFLFRYILPKVLVRLCLYRSLADVFSLVICFKSTVYSLGVGWEGNSEMSGVKAGAESGALAPWLKEGSFLH